MAERRMFANTITDSDAFLEMPQSTQNLYFHFGMKADDDGFINKPKAIMRVTGCKDDDLSLLVVKKFVILFDSGIVVIKHWNINNYIQTDRYHETKYKHEKDQLILDENNCYRLPKAGENVPCIQNVSKMDTEVSIGKERLGKSKVRINGVFEPPTIDELILFITETGLKMDPEAFILHYQSNGWKVAGRSKMVDWRASARAWAKRDFGNKPKIHNVEPIPDYSSESKPFTKEEEDALKERLKKLGTK